MDNNDILIGEFFPNPVVEGPTYLSVSLPEKGEIQFDFLDENGACNNTKHWQPKPWGDTIIFDLAHLPNGTYDVQIKIVNEDVVHRLLEIKEQKPKLLQKVKKLFTSLLSH